MSTPDSEVDWRRCALDEPHRSSGRFRGFNPQEVFRHRLGRFQDTAFREFRLLSGVFGGPRGGMIRLDKGKGIDALGVRNLEMP